MSERTYWESLKADSATLLDRLGDVIREGNVRRVIVEYQGRSIAEFPLTAGVVGLLLAPVAAAIGALVALLKECTIRVERAEQPASTTPETEATSVSA